MAAADHFIAGKMRQESKIGSTRLQIGAPAGVTRYLSDSPVGFGEKTGQNYLLTSALALAKFAACLARCVRSSVWPNGSISTSRSVLAADRESELNDKSF
jgi:hypothetical protein